jgi:hypothetical protein
LQQTQRPCWNSWRSAWTRAGAEPEEVRFRYFIYFFVALTAITERRRERTNSLPSSLPRRRDCSRRQPGRNGVRSKPAGRQAAPGNQSEAGRECYQHGRAPAHRTPRRERRGSHNRYQHQRTLEGCSFQYCTSIIHRVTTVWTNSEWSCWACTIAKNSSIRTV